VLIIKGVILLIFSQCIIGAGYGVSLVGIKKNNKQTVFILQEAEHNTQILQSTTACA